MKNKIKYFNVCYNRREIFSAFLLLFIIYFIKPAYLHSQKSIYTAEKKNYFLETKIHYGFIIKHHKKIAHLQTGHFTAFEINGGFNTYGKNAWDKLYHYPDIGYAFWYSNLDKSKYLGSAYAFFPYMKFHLIDKRTFKTNFRIGFGLGYLSKKFDQYENYKNIAIGSHINGAISILFETSWKINPQLSINTGIGLTHFSNGAFKIPNLGINIPTINLGSRWLLSKKQIQPIENQLPVQNKKFEFNTFLTFGTKEMYPPLSKKYFTCSYSALFYKLKNQKSKYGLGFDFFYNEGCLTVLRLPTNDFKTNMSIIRIGVSLAYELTYNRLSLLLQTGPYLKSRDKSDGSIYTRLGLRYQVSNKWYINLTLKTHFAKADNIEFGIGFKI